MAPIPRWRKTLYTVGLAILGLGVAVPACIEIERQVMRSRSERLLADVQQLQSRVSDWQDVLKIRKRWEAENSDGTPCTEVKCISWISIQAPLGAWLSTLSDRHPSLQILSGFYALVNPRYVRADAEIILRNSVVAESRFDLWVQVPNGNLRTDAIGYGLVGIATQYAQGFPPYEFLPARMLHPEYWIGKPGGCTNCIKLMTGYTPLAGRVKMHELSDFNFSCITRWSSCTKEADLMPSAGKQYLEELSSYAAQSEALDHCRVPLDFWGREAKNITIADVISRQPFLFADSDLLKTQIRPLRNLKGRFQWSVNKTESVSVFDRGQQISGWSSIDLVAGKRYILLGTLAEDKPRSNVLALDDCGVIPYTEQNLAEIQRGIDKSIAREIKLKQFEAGTVATAQ